ncbi:PEP-CTERM/exosortase system-associated acyltransferase [Pelagibius marinus]|uniref:PEP-CTERM/exosortase system-associated acyltransferase n=1 Tax=Pelagibius marinus TaxID=2762760 RepID=UPI0018730482|nr:PEP-CTERM/exosortase system-associated acyltransferase [Pelagibius marinus]
MGSQLPRHLHDHPALTTLQQPISSIPEAATPAPSSKRLEVLCHFDEVFSESPVSTSQDAEAAFRLRYLVYCLDRGFEDAEACPNGLERDGYDDTALHCLLRERAGRRPLGTVRLVPAAHRTSGIKALPLAEYAPKESIDVLRSLPKATTAEVSRFAITRSARDILWQSQEAVRDRSSLSMRALQSSGKLLPYMSLGLIRGLVRLSMKHGITHWCLAAEPSLLRRLRGFGLHFQNAGPLVEHRGLRQICFADLQALLARAEVEQPEFWDIITVGGFLLSSAYGKSVA